jgi:AAA domain
MGRRINAVTVGNLGGIGEQVTLSFAKGASATGYSALILGENGTGKSSVCDALEFVLRGVVSRRGPGGVKIKHELTNFHRPQERPSVTVAFDDGKVYGRGKTRGVTKAPARSPVEGFAKCPVVVRRRDVIGFWAAPAELRQDFFFDYLRAPGGAHLDQADRKAKIEAYEQAIRDFEDAVRHVGSYVGDEWRAEVPQHRGGVRILRHHLVSRHGPRGHDIADDFEAALEARNAAAAAGKQALAQRDEDRREMQAVLGEVAARVAEDYSAIVDNEHLDRIDFELDDRSGMAVTAHLANGLVQDPVQTLSEAHLDLLALLILLEVHIQCAALGQEKILVLDDVFQSVDRSLRLRTLDHLAGRLQDWQLLITVHDRLWLETCSRALSAANLGHVVIELRPYPPGKGPAIRQARVGLLRDTTDALAAQLSPALITGAAGRALEGILDQATQALGVKVARRPGDRYTIGDLWSPLLADLKQCETPGVPEVMRKIEHKRYLRNEVGAHFSEIADTLTLTEAEDFAQIVGELHNVLFCWTCLRPRGRSATTGGRWQLTAGQGCKHPPLTFVGAVASGKA